MEEREKDREELSEFSVSQNKNKLGELLRDISFAGYLETSIREVKSDLVRRKELAKVIYENRETFEEEAKLFQHYYDTMIKNGFSDFQSYDMLWNLVIMNQGFFKSIGGRGPQK